MCDCMPDCDNGLSLSLLEPVGVFSGIRLGMATTLIRHRAHRRNSEALFHFIHDTVSRGRISQRYPARLSWNLSLRLRPEGSGRRYPWNVRSGSFTGAFRTNLHLETEDQPQASEVKRESHPSRMVTYQS